MQEPPWQREGLVLFITESHSILKDVSVLRLAPCFAMSG